MYRIRCIKRTFLSYHIPVTCCSHMQFNNLLVPEMHPAFVGGAGGSTPLMHKVADPPKYDAKPALGGRL